MFKFCTYLQYDLISANEKSMKLYQWWVLDPNGKLIARFTWPRDKPIQEIKNKYLYTREKVMATRDSKIVRYQIKIEPNKKLNK